MILIINSLDRSGTEMFSCDLPGFISPLKTCSTGMIDVSFRWKNVLKSFKVFVFDIYGFKMHCVDSCCLN